MSLTCIHSQLCTDTPILPFCSVFISAITQIQKSGVILGQNCVRLSEAAHADLFFSKICFIKSTVNMLWDIGVTQIKGALL